MNLISIRKKDKNLKGIIHLPSSKSESNRALIIQALCHQKIELHNLSNAQDTLTLKAALVEKSQLINVGPSGTAMRFLTSFFASYPEKVVILTGSERMKNRPIGILVNALKKIGAEIDYLEKDGFPPLKIKGKELKGGKVEIEGKISSQFISSLLLIGPSLTKGIELQISGEIISEPYIKMTIAIMQQFGAEIKQERGLIKVLPKKYIGGSYHIESDWSAASYWYECAALSKEVNLIISGLKQNSLQGDSILAKVFEFFGISTTYQDNSIQLTKSADIQPEHPYFNYNFIDCPDIAQTVAATLCGLKIKGKLSGLNSLRIKETDRITALKNELSKFGALITINDLHDILITDYQTTNKLPKIHTYDDHRMAMAFAPLSIIYEGIYIENPEVVVKSYPNFWKDLKSIHFEMEDKTEC